MVVDAAYSVHINLGPGVLEKVYEVCFCHELTQLGLSYKRRSRLYAVGDFVTASVSPVTKLTCEI